MTIRIYHGEFLKESEDGLFAEGYPGPCAGHRNGIDSMLSLWKGYGSLYLYFFKGENHTYLVFDLNVPYLGKTKDSEERLNALYGWDIADTVSKNIGQKQSDILGSWNGGGFYFRAKDDSEYAPVLADIYSAMVSGKIKISYTKDPSYQEPKQAGLLLSLPAKSEKKKKHLLDFLLFKKTK